MRRRGSLASDDRSIETVVSHVMSVGITTLLIVSLVATATGFLDTHNTRAARDELDTVANRLTTSLEATDRLARNSDGTEVIVDLPDTIAGSTYTAELLNGSCGGVSTSTCVRLESGAHGLSTIVPVRNETALALSGDGGRFVVSSNGSDEIRAADRHRMDISPRVGVGHDFQSPVTTGRSLLQEPVARFEVNRSLPRIGEPINFDDSDSLDPVGNISYYEWDLNGNGSFGPKTTDPVYVDDYSTTGTKNITLRVTDNTGLTDSANVTLHVAGLNLTQNFTKATPANTNPINFTIKNDHQVPVTLTHVLIDPADSDQHNLSEIQFDKGPDGTIDEFIDWSNDPEPLEIPEDGAVVELDVKRDGTPVNAEVLLNKSEAARVTLEDFPDSVQNTDLTVGFSYRIRNNSQSIVFSGEVQPPGNGAQR